MSFGSYCNTESCREASRKRMKILDIKMFLTAIISLAIIIPIMFFFYKQMQNNQLQNSYHLVASINKSSNTISKMCALTISDHTTACERMLSDVTVYEISPDYAGVTQGDHIMIETERMPFSHNVLIEFDCIAKDVLRCKLASPKFSANK